MYVIALECFLCSSYDQNESNIIYNSTIINELIYNFKNYKITNAMRFLS